ncbi:MAG: homoserine kinase [Nitrospinaceae bacterium]|nr:homoserine kinase [Nitrospinaceae bacterium]MBT3434762.1 homoserine kinase [Nitrospinaceae bacterium]MBT3823064.1 homoserine kinase [Nitrospinaceae bacterium]MBT4095851.1 homoserine kinase [Nitrospinaceae bacterium]MBT4430898.1 homoserine kinase [Nitrospinaceae bacterium]
MPFVRVQVPSSTTNLGPGFDALGVALNLYNRVELDELPWGLSIHVEGEGADVIPLDETNISVEAVKRVYKKAGRTLPGLWMKQRNHIPLARGLGSSSAALVGGLVGANLLLGNPLSMDELVQLGVEMEGHPDNVVPALVGGFCISAINEDGNTLYTRAPVVDRYRWVIVVPDFEVSTKEARKKLPEQISLADGIYNVQRVGMLMAAFAYGQNEKFRESMQDKFHQPYRKELMGPLDEVFAAAYEVGAMGACISGAGPCVLAICDENAGKVGLAMREVYRNHGIGTKMHVLRIASLGAHAVDELGDDLATAV